MMRRRPLIGVTMQRLQAIEGIPPDLPPSVVMNQRYHLAVAAAGGVPVLVPLIPDDLGTLRELYDRLDGILLPGGVDINPAIYGAAPHEKLGTIDDARDRTELQLALWAMEDGKPVLGICRGAQMLNVACGGTLHQDIEAEVPASLRHDCFPHHGFVRTHLAHDVAVTAGTRLAAIAGAPTWRVNSLHHQAIARVGDGLQVSAVAPDGVVEGIERAGGNGAGTRAYLVGVQWHPEAFEEPDAATRALFASFVEACAG